MARLTDLCEDIIRIIVELLAGPVDPITDARSGVTVVAGSNFSKASLCAAARAHPIFTWVASPIIFRTIEIYLGKNRPPTLPTKYAIRERGLRKLRQILAAGTDRSRQLQTYIRVVDASWMRLDQEEHVKLLLDMAPNLQDLTLRNVYWDLAVLDFSQMPRLRRANIRVCVTCADVAKLAALPNLEFLALDQPEKLAIPSTCRQSPKRTPLACLDTYGASLSIRDLRWILAQFHGTKKLCTTIPLPSKKSQPDNYHYAETPSPRLTSKALLPAQASLEELEIKAWSSRNLNDMSLLDLSSFCNLTKLIVCAECFFHPSVTKNDISSCLPKSLEYLEIKFSLQSCMNALNNAEPGHESNAIDVFWLLQIARNKRGRYSSLKHVRVRENHAPELPEIDLVCRAKPWWPLEQIGIREEFELAGIELEVLKRTQLDSVGAALLP